MSAQPAEASTQSTQMAEQAAQLAIERLTERLQKESDLSATQLASLVQSVARFRKLYATLDRQAHKDRADEDTDAPPMPKRLDSKTLQVIREQVYGICS